MSRRAQSSLRLVIVPFRHPSLSVLLNLRVWICELGADGFIRDVGVQCGGAVSASIMS